MSAISNKKKKFIERNYKRLSLEELAGQTGLAPQVVKSVIESCCKGADAEKKHVRQRPQATAQNRLPLSLCALGIFVCTLAVYIPALNNDFVWDDIPFIAENPWIRSLRLQSLAEMFFSFRVGSWHPLTWISHAIDYHFWGSNPAGHHSTSLIIHALNAMLVFYLSLLLLARAGGRNGTETWITSGYRWIAAGITALLFGLHPVHVESVAWVAERKDLLCAFFVFLSLFSYFSYTASASKIRYALTLLFFIAALMSKPMAVTLPLVLLLCDLYPLKRIRGPLSLKAQVLPLVLEKIPFFAASCISGAITIAAGKSGGALRSLELIPLPLRLLNAVRTPGFYLGKMLLPSGLVPLYPFPLSDEWLHPGFLSGALAAVAITVILVWQLRQGNRPLFTAWSYYVITLLPVLGIVQVGDQAAADRYTYLPSVSVFLMAGIGVAWLFERRSELRGRAGSWLLMTASACVLLSLALLTVRQIEVWRNSVTLWQHVTRAFPFPRSSPAAHNNLGAAYHQQGEWDKAIAEYKQAVALRPRYADAHNNLGVAYAKKGMIGEAIAAHKEALAINPDLLRAHLNLGASYDKKGELDKAIEEYKKVLALDARYAAAHTNLAVVYYKLGNYRLAIEHCDKVAEIQGRANEELLRLLEPYRKAVP